MLCMHSNIKLLLTRVGGTHVHIYMYINYVHVYMWQSWVEIKHYSDPPSSLEEDLGMRLCSWLYGMCELLQCLGRPVLSVDTVPPPSLMPHILVHDKQCSIMLYLTTTCILGVPFMSLSFLLLSYHPSPLLLCLFSCSLTIFSPPPPSFIMLSYHLLSSSIFSHALSPSFLPPPLFLFLAFYLFSMNNRS